MKIKCIIVDDEPLAIEIIEAYIEKIPYLELVGKFTSGIEALQYLKNNNVDLLLLDIQMPDLTGIQLMRVLTEPPMVIFTTAFDNYALKSYEFEAVDYLLKPIELERFLKAIEKAWKRKEHNTHTVNTALQQSAGMDSSLFIKTEYRVQRIEKSEILYVEGMRNYLRFVTLTGKYMTLLSFNSAMQLLSDNQFIRVHKSFIIALDKIDTIERGRVKIGSRYIPIGDTYKKEFETAIDGLK